MSIKGRTAEVDFGGNVASVNVGLVKADVGMYVLVHAGMAIEAMDEEKARGVLDAWNQLNI